MKREELEALAAAGKLTGRFPDLLPTPYHTGPGTGSHGLMDILFKSPEYFQWHRTHPEEDPSPALVMGRVVHCLVLEPQKFNDQFCVKPLGTDRRTKEGKAAYEKWVAANIGKDEINHEVEGQARAMADRLRSHTKFAKMLKEGEAEVSYYAKVDGAIIRARPDLYVPKKALMVDVKTTTVNLGDDYALGRQIGDYHYDFQAAYYKDVLVELGFKVDNYILAFVSKDPPFATRLVRIGERTLEKGRVEYRAALEIYKRCVAEDKWPGLPDDITDIEVPEWSLKQSEAEDEA